MIPVKSADARAVWPHVSHFIQQAIDKTSGNFELDDILALIEEKKAQLFIVKDDELLSAWVTTIENSPSHKWIRVMWAGGKDMDRWLHFRESIEQWAKSIGCEKMIVAGRPGWERKLNDYTRTSVILEKVL